MLSCSQTPPGPDGFNGAGVSLSDDRAQRHLIDAAATSLGIFAIAATSAVEVLVFLHRYGTNDVTDGVFAAFALYAVVTVFAQNLRTVGAGRRGVGQKQTAAVVP